MRRSAQLTILVDIGERRSVVPEALTDLGIVVEEMTLAFGDYVVADGVGVERKSVADLHASIASGSLWSQLTGTARAFPTRYLLVEGSSPYLGPIGARGIRGVLLHAMEMGFRVVHSRSGADSAAWLCSIARRSTRPPNPGMTRTGRRRGVQSPRAVLAQVPGITLETAGLLLDRFGSIRGLANASECELRAIEGIGPARARLVAELLRSS